MMTEQESCRFPLFRETFLERTAWQSVKEDGDVPSTSQPEKSRSLERLQGGKSMLLHSSHNLSWKGAWLWYEVGDDITCGCEM